MFTKQGYVASLLSTTYFASNHCGIHLRAKYKLAIPNN